MSADEKSHLMYPRGTCLASLASLQERTFGQALVTADRMATKRTLRQTTKYRSSSLESKNQFLEPDFNQDGV